MCGRNKSQKLLMIFITLVMTIAPTMGTTFNARHFGGFRQLRQIPVPNKPTTAATTKTPEPEESGETPGAPGSGTGGGAGALESLNNVVTGLTEILLTLPRVGYLNNFRPSICMGMSVLSPRQSVLCQVIKDGRESMASTLQGGNGNGEGAATLESVNKAATAANKLLIAFIASGIVEKFNVNMCTGTTPLGPAHQVLCNAIIGSTQSSKPPGEDFIAAFEALGKLSRAF